MTIDEIDECLARTHDERTRWMGEQASAMAYQRTLTADSLGQDACEDRLALLVRRITACDDEVTALIRHRERALAAAAARMLPETIHSRGTSLFGQRTWNPSEATRSSNPR